MTNPALHAEREGVIKFNLRYTKGSALFRSQILEINHWRHRLWCARLIGQDPARYGGDCYGNISRRIGPLHRPKGRRRFVISGTQTGGKTSLGSTDYAVVEACSPLLNRVEATGPVAPSSESMTHGALYDLDASLRYVMHVHCAEIWRQAVVLGIPQTRPDVQYGTPEMADEMRRLFHETRARERGIYAMGGHEDGLIAFGRTGKETARILEEYHTRACQGEQCLFIMQAG